jgi:hopanoid biosynthesis associated protein HpnK
MKKVRLIINGDDFGMSDEVNHGVIRAFREGVLTSCSLMVSGSAFAPAVHLALENEGLAVGIHVVTVQGKSVLSHKEIPAIVDGEDNFPDDPVKAGLRYYFSRNARLQLKKELAAQFDKFAATGLGLSHIDSHLHMHVHPVIFDNLLQLGKRHGARSMRVPEDDLGLSLSFSRERWLEQMADGLVFKILCRRMKAGMRTEGLGYAGRVYGFFMSGRMSEEYALHALEHLGAGTFELYCHPAIHDESMELSSHERQRLKEFRILVSQRVKERLVRLGIEPTTYGEIRSRK